MSKYHKGKKNDQNPKRMNKKEAKPMNKKIVDAKSFTERIQ